MKTQLRTCLQYQMRGYYSSAILKADVTFNIALPPFRVTAEQWVWVWNVGLVQYYKNVP